MDICHCHTHFHVVLRLEGSTDPPDNEPILVLPSTRLVYHHGNHHFVFRYFPFHSRVSLRYHRRTSRIRHRSLLSADLENSTLTTIEGEPSATPPLVLRATAQTYPGRFSFSAKLLPSLKVVKVWFPRILTGLRYTGAASVVSY